MTHRGLIGYRAMFLEAEYFWFDLCSLSSGILGTHIKKCVDDKQVVPMCFILNEQEVY